MEYIIVTTSLASRKAWSYASQMQKTNTKWLTPDEAQAIMLPNIWALISHTGSLTEQFRKLTNDNFEFRFLNADWGEAYPTEKEKLELSDSERTWIRNIEVSYQDKLWEVGRIVISEHFVTEKLKHVGARPIGDVLFKDPNLKRSAFEFLLLDETSPYFQHIPHSQKTETPIWARRSILYFENNPLLVVEIFMPAVFRYAC